ncbi:MAG: ABC transporter substrate-binding protein [Chloroflexi bacterium]|nr:ABC transporter substrate-binding protein [Chloroflexota bacterium]
MIDVKSRLSIFALSLLLLSLACVGTTQPPAQTVSDSAGPAPMVAQRSAQEIVQAAKAVVERAVSTAVPADQGSRVAAAQSSNTAPALAPEPPPLTEPAAELKSTEVSLSFDAGESRQLLSPQKATVLLSPDGRVRISVRPGSVSEPVVLAYSDVDVAELPELPGGFVVGSRAFDLDPFRTDGTEIKDFAFQDSVSVTVPITIEDLRMADIDPFKITLQHFKNGQWSTLSRSFNLDDLTLTVSVSSLSTFALLIETTEPATNEPAPVARAQAPERAPVSAPAVSAPTVTPAPQPTQAAAIQEEPTAAPSAPALVVATVDSTVGVVLAQGAASLSVIRTTIGEGPELVLVESKKKVRHGTTFEIRVGAFDEDEDLSKLYMIDEDRRIVDEASCSGGICLHTFEVSAPLTYETPFEFYFVAVDSEGSESPLLTVKSVTRDNPFSGARAKAIDKCLDEKNATSLAEGEESPPGFPLKIRADNGSITFQKPPSRIIAYDSAVVEILFKIGEGDRIVGTHDFVFFPPEAEDIPRLGSAFSLNIEKFIELDPDLVYIFFPLQIEQMQEECLRVMFIPTRNNEFEDTADTIRMWGDITGAVVEAEEVAQEFADEVDALKELIEDKIDDGPSVFFSAGGMWTPGPNSLIGEVLDLLHLESISFDVDGFEQLSPEVLVERNPDVIVAFETDFDFFRDNPAFSDIEAVKNDAFVKAPDELNISGPRYPRGIEKLAEAIYPELFE